MQLRGDNGNWSGWSGVIERGNIHLRLRVLRQWHKRILFTPRSSLVQNLVSSPLILSFFDFRRLRLRL